MLRLALGSGILLLVLTGCVAPAGPSDPEPTPTPTVDVPVAAPGSRVPATCDELLSADALAAVVGASVALVSETADITSGALDSAGLTRCRWSSPDVIAVNAAVMISADDEDVSELRERPVYEPFVADSIVADSSLLCEVYDGSVTCHFSFPTARYAVDGWIQYPEPGATPEDETAGAIELLTPLASALEALEPLPEWTAPARSTVEFLDCAPLGADGAVAETLGWADAWGPSFDGSGDWGWAFYRALGRSGWNECAWGTPQGSTRLFVTYAPAAGWAWESGDPVEGDPVEIAGATRAVSVCDDYNCAIDALVGDSWVRAQIGRTDGDGIPEAARALEAAIPLLPIVAAD